MSVIKSRTPKAQTVVPAALRRHFIGLVEAAILHLGKAEVKRVVARHAPAKRK